MPVLGHMLRHVPVTHVPKHVPDRHRLDRHVPEHVLGHLLRHMPVRHVLEQVPMHVSRHVLKHVSEHMSRHMPQNRHPNPVLDKPEAKYGSWGLAVEENIVDF